MGRKEVLAFLNAKRMEGNDKFFTVGEIAKAIKCHRPNVWRDLEYLNNHNIVQREVQTESFLRIARGYRLRDKYIIPPYR